MGKISNLRITKRWGAMKLICEFSHKQCIKSGLESLIQKIDDTGSIERKVGSGRPKSARTSANIKKVEELICSQEEEPGTHKSPREIERITGIHRSSVQYMVKKDLVMRSYKRIVGHKLNDDGRIKHLQRCQLLLQRFPTERSTGNIWFTDEKTFSVATPVNSQNDRVYSNANRKRDVDPRHLIREHQHFNKSVMVSLGVSKMREDETGVRGTWCEDK